ncbi:MAG: septum site-determining protein MinC [Methylococcaceae bacterium]|nr:septum site-determining protein MinC [Methylococcaceae bacterium]
MSAINSEPAAYPHLFEIKNGAIGLPMLRLLGNNPATIANQLREKIRQAPDFFRGAPMVIDLHELSALDEEVDFSALVSAMRDCGLVPVGICGGTDRHLHAAQTAGLSLLADVKHESSHQPVQAVDDKPKQPAVIGKVIEHPVRSGQRIYAPGGDLVVLSQVSAGAEIMADGNIHVYGTLRGRALAGVQGNLDSRIFCLDLQAELIAIGGHYKVSENIEDSVRGLPVHIYLIDNSLKIEKI